MTSTYVRNEILLSVVYTPSYSHILYSLSHLMENNMFANWSPIF
jgi:hypothetical protein